MSLNHRKRQAGDPSAPHVIAITGGKGGVGKTSVSVNLAIALARLRHKVCLFDADTGLANINVMLGLYPSCTLEHLLTGERSLQDVVLQGPEGIHIVPGASGFSDCIDMDVGQQQRLLSAIRSLEPHYDYLLVDTAAGVSATVLHFIAACQVAVVVLTPEPTSLTDAFSLLKVLKRRGYKRKVQILLNMVESAAQADKVFQRFRTAVDKYLDLPLEYLGAIWRDESMRAAVSLQRPVALFPRDDPSARSFFRLAERLEDLFMGPVPRLAFSAYWQRLIERRSQGVVTRKSVAEHEARLPVLSSRVETAEAPEVNESAQEQWVDVRRHFNAFLQAPDTTPEQVLTLLSMGLSQWSQRLGAALGDLVCAAMDGLQPEQLDAKQRAFLSTVIARLGLWEATPASLPTPVMNDGKDVAPTEEDERPEDSEHVMVKTRYDASFGNQEHLADRIRRAGNNTSLESLLESIKYASLVDSSDA